MLIVVAPVSEECWRGLLRALFQQPPQQPADAEQADDLLDEQPQQPRTEPAPAQVAPVEQEPPPSPAAAPPFPPMAGGPGCDAFY